MAQHPTKTSSKRVGKPVKKTRTASAFAKTQIADLTIPKGFRRRNGYSESQAHLLVATSSASMGPPPYICVPTGPSPQDPCLRYYRDPKTGEYNTPRRGEVVPCAICRGG